MKNLISAAFLVGMFLAAPCAAQARLPVQLTTTTNDVVGEQLAYLVKEGIAGSHTLQLTYDQTAPRAHVFLITLDPLHNGEMTVFSVTITFDAPSAKGPIYLTSFVASVGANNVAEAAVGIVANVSQSIDPFGPSFEH